MSAVPARLIEVHIDRVVLDDVGLTSHDVPRFRAALHAELTERLQVDGIPAMWGEGAALDHIATTLPGSALGPAHAAGRSIARAVHEGFVA